MTKNSDTSPWMRFPDNPKAIRRHNELVLSSIPTADLVAELSKRDGVIVPHPELAGSIVYKEIWTAVRGNRPEPKILVVRE